MTQSYVSATHEVIDGAGFIWDIQGDGSIYDGSDDAFDYGMDFTYLGSSSYLIADDSTQTYSTFSTAGYYGIVARRQVHVSQVDGYARFFDTVTNASDSLQSFTYTLTLDFGSDGLTALQTSSGDAAVADDDTWVVGYSSDDGTTPSGALFSNMAGQTSSGLSHYYDDVTYEFTIELAPGETASFLSFASQGNSHSDVSDTLADLQDLPLGALTGLSAEDISNIINWDLPDTQLDLEGTSGDDHLFGSGNTDVIRTFSGNDLVFGGGGNDTLRGGFDADTLFGGDGHDQIFGDGTVSQITTSTTETLPSGEEMAVSLTMDDAGRGGSTRISGFISRQEVTSEDVNLVFAIDVSGSTSNAFSGSIDVGDRNGDGYSNTILDAEIASFEALHSSIVNDANLPDADLTIVPFEGSANISQTFSATADANADGVADVLEYVRSLRSVGGTDFEEALQITVNHFTGSSAGQNVLYFLSDGEDGSNGSLSDEVQELLDLGVQVQSFGVGSGASETDLDIVDDGISNGTTTIVLDPSALSGELLDPGIDATDLSSLFVYVNGNQVASIDPTDLAITPFGLRYFELDISGLNRNADDVVEIRAIVVDGPSTTISTSQILEDLDGKDGKDRLIGGLGNDSLYGGAQNDVLMGGQGADLLEGGQGKDVASYATAETGVVVDLTETLVFRGEAFGDELNSIEGLTGSSFGDILAGNGGKNQLRGLSGNDELIGNGGKDVLNGGRGNDTLAGGAGADKFVFKDNGGRDLINDFAHNKRGEKVDLRDFEIDSFSDLRAMMSNVRGDAVIKFGGGDTLTFEGLSVGDFSANDFIL